MRIELLGDNCSRCRRLQANIERALQHSGIATRLERVEEPRRFAEYGLLALPAIAVDGRVLAAGSLPSTRELRALLEAHSSRH